MHDGTDVNQPIRGHFSSDPLTTGGVNYNQAKVIARIASRAPLSAASLVSPDKRAASRGVHEASIPTRAVKRAEMRRTLYSLATKAGVEL